MAILLVVVALIIVLIYAYILICRYNFQKLANTPLRNPIDDPSQLISKRVVIVGAGVAGVAAAKTFLQYGYEDVIVLERSKELGGVWNSNQYAGASIQQAYWLYQYPDFPWPKDLIISELSPGRANVQEYLRRYAEQYGVLDRIRYNCEVKTAIRDEENGTWTVNTDRYGLLAADILIMAVGNNDSSNPIIPNIPNQNIYRGKILHSSQVGDGADLRDADKIAVIGGSKSAFDIGQFQPDKTTLIMRTPHYWFPRWFVCLPFFDRITCFLFRGYHPDHQQRSWIIRLIDEISSYFAIGLNKPTTSHSVLDDIMVGGGIHVCTTLSEYNIAKRWDLVRSSPVAYTTHGLELANGDTIEADVIVWGTGFGPTTFFQNVFPEVSLQDSLDDGLYLYKYIVHPSLPSCFFIGFRDPALMTLTNVSLQSLWAVSFAAGNVVIPDPSEMTNLLDERQRDSRLRFPYSHRRAFYDYFLRKPKCDYTYGVDLVRDCGLEERLARFWSNPANIWSAPLDFAAILSMPVQHEGMSDTGVELSNESIPLAQGG